MKQEWEAYWDNYRFPEHFMQSEIEPFGNPVRVLIAELAQEDTVLDVGCASCISFPLFEPCKYVGVDFTLKLLKAGRKKNPKVSVVHGYGLSLPFKDKAFGTVFIKDVLEHLGVDAYKTVIPEMWRVASRQIIIAFYGNLDHGRYEMIREPDEHNTGVPAYRGGLYYFNAYDKKDICAAIEKLPEVDEIKFMEKIPRENCPEDKEGRTVVLVRKQNELS